MISREVETPQDKADARSSRLEAAKRIILQWKEKKEEGEEEFVVPAPNQFVEPIEEGANGSSESFRDSAVFDSIASPGDTVATAGSTKDGPSLISRGQQKLSKLEEFAGKADQKHNLPSTPGAFSSTETGRHGISQRGRQKLNKLAQITGRQAACNTTNGDINSGTAYLGPPVIPRGKKKLAKLAAFTGRRLPQVPLSATNPHHSEEDSAAVYYPTLNADVEAVAATGPDLSEAKEASHDEEENSKGSSFNEEGRTNHQWPRLMAVFLNVGFLLTLAWAITATILLFDGRNYGF